MNKNDPRYISAEKKIIDAVFELFTKKDIESIKTQDIISRAGIHKSTFYSHYSDKYALIESLVKIAAERMTPHLEGITVNMLGSMPNGELLMQNYRDMAKEIMSNKDILLIISRSSMGDNLTLKIVSELERIWKESGIADPGDRHIAYFINGAAYVVVGTIEKWLRNGCSDSFEDLALQVYATGEGLRTGFYLLR